MSVDELREEFNIILKEKNFNYTDPDVIKKAVELEKLLYSSVEVCN